MAGKYEVNDFTNKIDVGSQPGTMWSLSSQKPGHGIAELRDDDTTKLWQSDGFLPHLITIQFAQRTAVTHVSLYTDFRLDDSYTPIKIRIMAGTHHHDLVEVRTREFVQPIGWKHFAMDKFDSVAESEESGSESSSSSTVSDELSDSTIILNARRKQGRPLRQRDEGIAGNAYRHHQSPFLACGVSRKHPPIHTHLIQICIIANHAVGKDTHVRGIKIFGPPTVESREKARRDVVKGREARRVTGPRAIRQRKEKDLKRKRKAMEGLRRWVEVDEQRSSGALEDDEEGDESIEGEARGEQRSFNPHIPTSRRLDLLSTLR